MMLYDRHFIEQMKYTNTLNKGNTQRLQAEEYVFSYDVSHKVSIGWNSHKFEKNFNNYIFDNVAYNSYIASL